MIAEKMTKSVITADNYKIPVYTLNTVVVGTGAAGYNAADRLYNYGQKDIAIVTENVYAGTSRNTGSDKQTYYKLTLSGGDPDSVREMAETLFNGQCVDGDLALCEAALSAQCFLRLAELGVPFPKNRYGEYIGYKTDHDPRRRATSVGPYTSRRMTECLQASVEAKGVKVFDKMQTVRVLGDGSKVFGLLCINLDALDDPFRAYTAFNCKNIVFATGGPAGMYADSVYPAGHYGATGLAFEAGVRGKNLTEWQYGLASTNPRWNVSGTYMQSLPRFISTDAEGQDEREFLFDFFAEKGEMLSKVFLKGYQWPFDVRKVAGGSSIIDILVFLESNKNRKVFLDFRRNARGEDIDYSSLSGEAREYLEKAGACFGSPIQRLIRMNKPAVDFYLDKGVDLAKEPLEIAVCAQHNNGGLDVDCWWRTNLEGFYAVGEVSASHGVYRPGGSALNAGQAGSARCAQHIAAKRTGCAMTAAGFEQAAKGQIKDALDLAQMILSHNGGDNLDEMYGRAAALMSKAGASIRSIAAIREASGVIWDELADYGHSAKAASPARLPMAYRLREILICQYVYLCAMTNFIEIGGKSRGSALYTDPRGQKPYACLPDDFTFTLDDGVLGAMVQEVLYQNGCCAFNWRKVRPIPEDDDFFENVWRDYRKNGNVY